MLAFARCDQFYAIELSCSAACEVISIVDKTCRVVCAIAGMRMCDFQILNTVTWCCALLLSDDDDDDDDDFE